MTALNGDEAQAQMSTARLVLIVGAAALGVVALGLLFAFVPLDWPLGGIYLRIVLVSLVINTVCVVAWNPKLIRRRMAGGSGTKTWDYAVLALLLPSMGGVGVVAGVDGRDWVGGTPGPAWITGLVIHVVAWAILSWGMSVNEFFEKTVRIQTDHGHHLIDSGPYAFVRHPGYVGFSLWAVSAPLLLGSTWAFVPAIATVAVFVVRTALEDRMLQAELPGYAEYATRTRYRLIPGVW